ncbi:MAG: hypothetical protein MJ245_02105 [Clostridia bacterium]|nr:hypothetical protein [Clostridia bacterium]
MNSIENVLAYDLKNDNKKFAIKSIITFILLTLFLFVFNKKVYANQGRFAEDIIIKGTSELILNEELINVDVNKGTVTGDYEFYNPSAQNIKAKILFPITTDYSKLNFSSYVNDSYVLAKLNDNNTYYEFEATFLKNETTKIKIAYDCIWKVNDDYSVVVGCNRNNQSTYKDAIKHTKITFDFGDLANYYVVSPNDNSTYKRVDNKLVWEATNYTNKENVSLLMRLKLLTSKTDTLSYYDSKNALKDFRILIDVDSLYTKTLEEKNIVIDAANFLKIKLEELGCEVAISNNVEELEKKIKKEAKFDLVLSLICKTSQDPNMITKEVYIEPFKKGNESNYIESDMIAKHIINAGSSGVSEYFANLRDNNLIPINNVLKYVGGLDVNKVNYDAPRVIISLGYISDFQKTYESYEGIMEKTRLGLAIMNEVNDEEENNKNTIITKNNYKVTKGKKNIFQKVGNKISKFFKYNIVTIISSVMIGIGLAIVIFVVISNHFEKKMKISYEDIQKREKAIEEKIALIEKTKIENEKHKETLKEILRNRLNKIKNKEENNSSNQNQNNDVIKINLKKEDDNTYTYVYQDELPKENVTTTADVTNNSASSDYVSYKVDETSFANNIVTKKENKFINGCNKFFSNIKTKMNDAKEKNEERKLNKFSKTSKGEAKKILSKVNNKNISK